MKHCRRALLVSAILLAPGTTFAADPSVAQQIEALQQQLRALQQQSGALQQQLDALKAAEMSKDAIAREAKERTAASAAVTPAPAAHVAESAAHKFSFESADGRYSIGPTGILQIDVGGYLNYRPQSPVIGPQHLSSGVNARRARIGVAGKLFGDFAYKFIYDGGNSQDNVAAGIQSAQITYNGFKGIAIDLPGYSATLFTLDQATSSTDLTFIERSTPTNVAISVNAGDFRTNTGVRVFGDRYWFGAYLTGPASGDGHTNVRERFGAFQRAAFQILNSPDYSVHLGAAVDEVLQVPDTGPGTARTITLSDRPELRIDPTQLLNTGALGTVANPVTGATVYNVEAAAAWQNLFLQSEYFRETVARRGLRDAGFDGVYGQVSWVLTGEGRHYDRTAAAYGGITPARPFSLANGGWGAWEIAARVSYADLTNHLVAASPLSLPPPDTVNGGKQTSYTLALNWYPNSLMRVMANYIHTDFDKFNGTAVTGAALGARVGAVADALAVRFQVSY